MDKKEEIEKFCEEIEKFSQAVIALENAIAFLIKTEKRRAIEVRRP